MCDKTISVIIPVYNTVNYLDRCIGSICNQTYTNLEIICIDDGSTDGSEKIVDKYAAIDNRVKAVHQINAGESAARNKGIKMATGDYIAFVDCDDWLELDMYEVLIKQAEQNHADMAAGRWYWDTDSECREITNSKLVSENVFDRTQLLRYIYERDSYRGFAYMWNKLYRTEMFKDSSGNLLLFDEQLKLGGDVLMLAQLALNAHKTVYIDRAFYHYYQRANSGCHSVNLEKRQDWLKAYEIVIDIFNIENIEKIILDYVKRFLAYHCCNVAKIAYEQKNDKVLVKCQHMMEKYQKEYESLNQDKKDRIMDYREVLKYEVE